MTRGAAKAAELASGLGGVVLGAGLALLAPDRLHALAVPLLAAGVAVHGVGMALKHRFEAAAAPPLWWEQALFWSCWACLAGILLWLGMRLAP